MRLLALGTAVLTFVACNPAPSEEDLARLGQVGYRDPGDPDATHPASSGERGSVKISEIHWAGSRTNDGVVDRADVFVELRNESARPLNLSDWYLELHGAVNQVWRIPVSDRVLDVGEHAVIASKDDGCFVDPDWVIPTLAFPYGDPILLVLKDADERLMEPAGSDDQPPFAGGDDGVQVRSMERLQIMFGGEGGFPQSWHFYTEATVQVPNNDKVAADCREATLASPGRPNSPDYSGAFASGSFE